MDKKILIIEDVANILAGLTAQFSADGINILQDNGTGEIKDILELIITHKPDYIILDLVLPNIDGFELLQTIKGKSEEFKAPVFIFTNLSDQDSKVRCEQLGADYFFIKSYFNIEEFTEKVKNIINNRDKNNL